MQEAGTIPSSTMNHEHPRAGFWRTVQRLCSMGFEMLRHLGSPGWGLVMFLRLVLFAAFMSPGIIPSFARYVLSDRILRNVAYGPSLRHQLDIYLPQSTDRESGSDTSPSRTERAPVVIFVTGGAWVIGWKAWTWIMGLVMQTQGVLFVSVDYRNFPQASAGTMVQDVVQAVGWVLASLDGLGGDRDNVVLVGQSAGAHLSCMALIEQARRERGELAAGRGSLAGPAARARPPTSRAAFREDGEWQRRFSSWSPRSLRSWAGISGPYELESFTTYLAGRGLPPSIFRAIMGTDVRHLSPVARLERNLALPPIVLFHGSSDRSVPEQQSMALATALKGAGARVELKLYPGKAHTDVLLEDCLAGRNSEMMLDVLDFIKGPLDRGSVPSVPTSLPGWMLRCAQFVNPF